MHGRLATQFCDRIAVRSRGTRRVVRRVDALVGVRVARRADAGDPVVANHRLAGRYAKSAEASDAVVPLAKVRDPRRAIAVVDAGLRGGRAVLVRAPVLARSVARARRGVVEGAGARATIAASVFGAAERAARAPVCAAAEQETPDKRDKTPTHQDLAPVHQEAPEASCRHRKPAPVSGKSVRLKNPRHQARSRLETQVCHRLARDGLPLFALVGAREDAGAGWRLAVSRPSLLPDLGAPDRDRRDLEGGGARRRRARSGRPCRRSRRRPRPPTSLPSIVTLRRTSGPLPIRFTPLSGAVIFPSSMR